MENFESQIFLCNWHIFASNFAYLPSSYKDILEEMAVLGGHFHFSSPFTGVITDPLQSHEGSEVHRWLYTPPLFRLSSSSRIRSPPPTPPPPNSATNGVRRIDDADIRKIRRSFYEAASLAI